MSRRNKDDFTDEDKTGEIISWVVIFILLFAFFPLGLFFLFLKLRGSISSGGSKKSSSDQSDNRYRDAVPVKYTAVQTQTTAAPTAATQTTTAHTATPNYTSATQATATPTTAQVPPTHAASQTSATSASKKSGKIRHPLKKKSGRFISAVMLVISIALIIMGLIGTATVIQQLFWWTFDGLNIAMSAFFLLGGVATFLSRNVVARRYSRFKNYFAFIGERGVVPLAELAQVSGVSVKAAKRDLQMMINNGFLFDGTYIDHELECLVISHVEAQKLRMEIRDLPFDDSSVSQPKDSAGQSTHTATLAELREVNSFIVDDGIRDKVSHLAEVTAKIFKIVDETPEKMSQLKRFLSYYLPTTIKLVRSYVTLERQGIKGENIAGAKENIGNILDTLSTGFEQQLDMLFKADALDIAADINVLENLMQQDGLMSSGSGFQATRQ